MRDLKSPTLIPDQGMFRAISRTEKCYLFYSEE